MIAPLHNNNTSCILNMIKQYHKLAQPRRMDTFLEAATAANSLIGFNLDQCPRKKGAEQLRAEVGSPVGSSRLWQNPRTRSLNGQRKGDQDKTDKTARRPSPAQPQPQPQPTPGTQKTARRGVLLNSKAIYALLYYLGTFPYSPRPRHPNDANAPVPVVPHRWPRREQPTLLFAFRDARLHECAVREFPSRHLLCRVQGRHRPDNLGHNHRHSHAASIVLGTSIARAPVLSPQPAVRSPQFSAALV